MDNAYWMTFVVIAIASACFASEENSSRAVDQGELRKSCAAAIDLINQALANEASTPKAGADVERLRKAAAKVADVAHDNYEVSALLGRAVKETRKPAEAVKGLRSALAEAREILAFRPVLEAARPKGFPAWTPVGEIHINEYPTYRLARTPASNGEKAAFWILFNHIESSGIAMTAPVEMSYGPTQSNLPRVQSMAFLYANTEIGQTGSRGKVEVIDVPEVVAVSIGARGDVTAVAITAAESRLKSWLSDRTCKYEVVGDLRVLGYNSPLIPVDRRYFEVQLPIRESQDNK
jgi:hypothetical protein